MVSATTKNQLFRETPPYDLCIKILNTFGLANFDDLKYFSRHDLKMLGCVEKMSMLKIQLERYYLPCKARTYLNDLNTKNVITILRQIVRLYGYTVLSREKYVKGDKFIIYQLTTNNAYTYRSVITVKNKHSDNDRANDRANDHPDSTSSQRPLLGTSSSSSSHRVMPPPSSPPPLPPKCDSHHRSVPPPDGDDYVILNGADGRSSPGECQTHLDTTKSGTDTTEAETKSESEAEAEAEAEADDTVTETKTCIGCNKSAVEPCVVHFD